VPDTDVLVAGSGAAGLTAALAAAAGGARVLLAERTAELGGTTALSFGRVWVPGNHRSSGDGPDAARAYLEGIFGERYPHMTEAFIQNAPAMARFVENHSPLRFTACVNYPDYHPSRPGATRGGRALDIVPVETAGLTPLAKASRMPPGYLPLTHAEWEEWRYPGRFHWALIDDRKRRDVRAGGAGLVAGLLDGAVRAGVRVRTRTRLVNVRLDAAGAVAAADLERDGQVSSVPVAAVILATGGFDRDEELRARTLPAPVAATGAPRGNTGDALRIAAGLGAETGNMAEGWWMPMVAIPGETLDGEPYYQSLIRERALPRQIIVNAAGRRFADEALPYHEFGKAMHRRDPDGGYPNGTAWMIFDAGFRQSFPIASIGPGEPLPGWVAQAVSLAQLAVGIGVDGSVLADTVGRWNQACAGGSDLEFGRGNNVYERYMGDPGTRPNPNLGPVDQPPYYAVQVLSGTIGTKGGPVTDARGGVLAVGGRPIPGLYAAGNASAFWTSAGYPGPGATLAVAMTMGYLAGRAAADGPLQETDRDRTI
jgi:3-oxosteroid 1-dehydrogenase